MLRCTLSVTGSPGRSRTTFEMSSNVGVSSPADGDDAVAGLDAGLLPPRCPGWTLTIRFVRLGLADGPEKRGEDEDRQQEIGCRTGKHDQEALPDRA